MSMNTPILDFVRRYGSGNALRLHMPGHKGKGPLGIEAEDITEIDGADSLYEASGIIRESEENASSLFGCRTFYSTEGSSLCIRAMLYLVCLAAGKNRETSDRKPLIFAGRNCHKSFLSAAALLDLDVRWLYGDSPSYLSCHITPAELDAELERSDRLPDAVYLTSPDYLGNVLDISGLSAVCRRRGVMLMVDNAHGAYLRFLDPTRHPIDLGADICCDSAHKTLPVLTGGAYLHISPSAPAFFEDNVRAALAMFGSSSPSYLILASLDAANRTLSEGYCERLAEFSTQAEALRQRLAAHGFILCGDEPLKLTLAVKPRGYTGKELSRLLAKRGIVCEFSDPDFIVMMLTPEIGCVGLSRLEDALMSIPQRAPIDSPPPLPSRMRSAMSIRRAAMSPRVTVPACRAEGRILAGMNIGCPPAVPIAVCGEVIDHAALRCFEYYGFTECTVVDEHQ